MKPPRGYASLRRYRTTIPGVSYFLTLCTRGRSAGLNRAEIAGAIREQIDALERDTALVLQAAVIMPDHLHLLGIVTGQLTVGQLVGRIKAKTRASLLDAEMHWQGNFYEHRLRPDDPIEDVLRYLFLNPYGAELLAPNETYPWFWLGQKEAAWFRPTLDHQRPLPAWLDQADTLPPAGK